MPRKERPVVSVVILNWNGKKFLKTCLSSLFRIRHVSIEIIVVDNNSSDGSQIYIRKHFPRARLITSKKNNGFARGNNIGAKAATGKYLLFLNNDTKVTPNFLTPLIDACKKDSQIGCVQPEMRVMSTPNLLDEAGAYLTLSGFLYHYGYRKNHQMSIYGNTRKIFSAKGACMLIPRKIFTAVGAFDEDFFIFFEETDLCFRIWLAGYSVVYIPRSYIFHVAGGDTTDTYNYERRIYLTFKNMNQCYLKNFGLRNLITVMPIFICFQIGLLLYFLISGRFHLVGAMMRAYWWNLIHIRETFDKRMYIQTRLRKVSDSVLSHQIFYNPGMFYYYCLLFDAKRYKDSYISSV